MVVFSYYKPNPYNLAGFSRHTLLRPSFGKAALLTTAKAGPDYVKAIRACPRKAEPLLTGLLYYKGASRRAVIIIVV